MGSSQVWGYATMVCVCRGNDDNHWRVGEPHIETKPILWLVVYLIIKSSTKSEGLGVNGARC